MPDDETDWTEPEAWEPEDGGRPFRGVDPEELDDETLVAGSNALRRALARQRQRVDELEKELPRAEARGEEGIEELEEARKELERLQAVKRAWRGPVKEAKERRRRRRRIEAARSAREGLEEDLDELVEARTAYRAARQRVRSKLARLHRVLQDGDLRAHVEPLAPETVEKIRRVNGGEDLAPEGRLDALPEEGEEGPDRRIVDRPDEVLLVGDWSREEKQEKAAEYGKSARVVERA